MNTNNIATNSVANVSQDTINSIFVDILRGTREAGSEIYAAGKAGLVKAVDFAQEQAPLVVQEFLKWNFAHAAIHLTVAVIILITLIWCVRKCYKFATKQENIDDASCVPAWIGILILIVCIFGTGESIIPNVETMVKIKVAPRVYLIEYAVDKAQGVRNNIQRRY